MALVSLLIAVLALAASILAVRRADVVDRRARTRAEASSTQQAVPAAEETSPTIPGMSGLSMVGLVRYDALDDSRGQLSYSCALLDPNGHGVVMTAIHGRSETRSYAKRVPDGTADPNAALSPEERAAIKQALEG